MRIKDLEYRYFRKRRKFKAQYAKARSEGQITQSKVVRFVCIGFLLFSALFTAGPSSNRNNKTALTQEEATSLEKEKLVETPQVPTKLPDSPEFNLSSANAALVIDLQTGTVLYQKDETQKLPMASLTKIMTALLVLESFKLDEEVMIPASCLGLMGNNFGLASGEKLTVEELLLAMLVGSNSDAACALALHKTSLEEFVLVMNAKAKELGLEKTQFKNPIGLDEPEHYSTASDLIKLAKNALKNEKFRAIVGTKTVTIRGKEIKNTNELLFESEGITGVKTGYTKEALGCLLVSAKRGEYEILAVLLGSEDRFSGMKNLVDWIYRVYNW